MTRRRRGAIAFALLLGVGVAGATRRQGDGDAWRGVDEAVIGRFVLEAGRPPPSPVIDLVRGDLLLFAFLCAGLAAGFVLGFWGRALFVDGAARDDGRTDEHV